MTELRSLLRPYVPTPRSQPGTPDAVRLARLIDYQGNDACWEWRGATQSNGYGNVHIGGRLLRVHRVTYELLIGAIPDGLQIDHLCRNRVCCNPSHLEPVTKRENLRRGEGFAGLKARQTHCIHGHEFSPENTYTPPSRPGGRMCRECLRRRARELKRRRRSH